MTTTAEPTSEPTADSPTEHDRDQDRRLDRIEHVHALVDASLPGIDTPVGAKQRLKIHVPTPDSLFTVGAIGSNDAAQAPAGPGGFAFRTIENLAAEIHKRTILDTDLDTIIHTGKKLVGVAGELLALSTNGDYQVGAVGGVDITADGGAGFTDPALTIVPDMGVPDPPEVDTAGPRSSTETQKTVWEGVWTAWDVRSGAQSLRDVVKKRQIAKGVGKDTFAAKATGLYSIYSNAKTLIDVALAGISAVVAATDFSSESEKESGPGKPKVTIYATDGVTITTPAKITEYATEGVSIGSPKSVGIKGGLGASMKAGVSATVFAFVSAKLESEGVAAVKGKVLTLTGEYSELIGKEVVHVSSDKTVAITSDENLRMSSKNKLEVSGHDLFVGSDSFIRVACDDVIELHATNQNNLWGDKKVFVHTEGGGEILLQVGDGDDKIEMGPDLVSVNSKSHAELVVGGNYVEVGKSKIDLGADTIQVKGSTIKLG